MNAAAPLQNSNQLLVVDTVTGLQWVEALLRSPVRIGRPAEDQDDPDIVLASPLVSRARHAILHWTGDSWQIEHQGLHDTLLDGLPLKAGRAYPLLPGQVIRIAQFNLILVTSATETEQPAETVLSPTERLMELEQQIHTELLRRLDLRRADAITDLNSEQSRRQIRQTLDELIAQVLAPLPDDVLEGLAGIALYRRLSIRIMAAGGDTTAEEAEHLDVVYRGKLVDVETRLARAVGVSFDRGRMEQESARLDAGFEQAYAEHRLLLMRGLREYLVGRLIKRDLWNLIFGLGPLQDFMDMNCVTEIMVVSRSQIFIEKFGVLEDARRAFFNDDALMSVIERIVGPVGRRVDRSTPLVDARLADGSRVNVIIPPLAVKGPCVTIRKFAKVPLEMEDLIRKKTLSAAMNQFLQACVEGRKNIIVSGGTGTGKTTLLNCLSRFIPYKERIVSIEDTAELQLQQRHVVTLESRPANMEGKGAVTIQDLVKNALRMRPDRVVVGECRGAEALDMLQAMNTGHDGSLTTGHANSPKDMMLRLETMVLMGREMPVAAIREQIVSALDVVVQLTRFADGSRRVTSVAEVTEIDEDSGEILLEDIFVYRPPRRQQQEGQFAHTGYIPTFIDEWRDSGRFDLATFF